MTDIKTNRMSKADRPEEDDEFPRMVFRYMAGGVIVPGGFTVDHIIVGNRAALDNALDHGWHLDPQRAQEAEDKEQEERMRRREGKGGKDSDRPRDKNMREIDQHSGLTDYTETADNPRPNEPDNAPFQNTPYIEPQTGDLADPPTSPAERPVPSPIPPEDLKPPGEEPAPPGVDNTLPEEPLDKPPPGTDPPLGGSRAGEKLPEKRENHGGGLTDKDKSDHDKGAPSRGPGRPKGS